MAEPKVDESATASANSETSEPKTEEPATEPKAATETEEAP